MLSAEDARPIGVKLATLRTLILGVATLPTIGFGAAALAWTAMVDPTGWRRGWHDLRARSVVVDIRPAPVLAEPEEEAPRQVVNLTAMRLVPASPTPPRRIPSRGRRPAEPPQPPPSSPARGRPDAHGHPPPGAGLAAGRRRAGRGAVRARRPGRTPPGPKARPRRPPGCWGHGPPRRATGAARRPHRAHASEPTVRWEVSFDTGEQFEVRGLTLVGRRPEPRPGEPVKRLVTLPSDDMSLSKTHAQFQVVPDGALVVMDRGSTNGSILIRAGVTKRLDGGKPATLREGDRVRFGDREMSVARLP